MDGTEDTGRRESRNAGEIPSGETKSVVHPCGHLAAWMREALPVGFCNGFVKGTHGSARGHFVCSFLEMCGCLAELFCSSQSCPLLLQSLLVHLSLLASFLALDQLQRDDCVVHESEWVAKDVAKESNCVALNPFSEKKKKKRSACFC